MIYLLPHTILNSADRFPDRLAFKCGQHSLSFSQLAERINQLANLLHELKIKKGDRVGIYLNRSIETAIAIHGIMHAGAVYVPLDPKAPAHQTQFLLKDCDIKILITNSSQKKNIEKLLAHNVKLNAIIGLKKDGEIPTISWEEVDQQANTFTCPFPVLEKDLAYIMYTSGSTGNPKGIMHTHASGLSYARLSADLYQVNETDRIGNHAPIYFDISTFGYFTAPLVGAGTLIVSDAHTIFPNSLSQLLEKEKITVWYSVPLAIIQMLEKGQLTQKDLSALRWILYGGEVFPTKYLRVLMQQFPHIELSNVYGPAEVNQCTYYHFSTPPNLEESIPLGQVWNNTEKIILDENGKELKNGTGELLIRSTTMMQGYWNQEELTQQSLYKKKTNSGIEEIFYKTGDLVKLDEDGILHFLGRKDHQIKIRGYRVELSSVENFLVMHSSVSEAVAFTKRNEDETLQINAAVILNNNNGVTGKDLSLFLKEKLPVYAIPTSIEIVKDFPRTASGKVKRTAL